MKKSRLGEVKYLSSGAGVQAEVYLVRVSTRRTSNHSSCHSYSPHLGQLSGICRMGWGSQGPPGGLSSGSTSVPWELTQQVGLLTVPSPCSPGLCARGFLCQECQQCLFLLFSIGQNPSHPPMPHLSEVLSHPELESITPFSMNANLVTSFAVSRSFCLAYCSLSPSVFSTPHGSWMDLAHLGSSLTPNTMFYRYES